jgi:hypothetical protein
MRLLPFDSMRPRLLTVAAFVDGTAAPTAAAIVPADECSVVGDGGPVPVYGHALGVAAGAEPPSVSHLCRGATLALANGRRD